MTETLMKIAKFDDDYVIACEQSYKEKHTPLFCPICNKRVVMVRKLQKQNNKQRFIYYFKHTIRENCSSLFKPTLKLGDVIPEACPVDNLFEAIMLLDYNIERKDLREFYIKFDKFHDTLYNTLKVEVKKDSMISLPHYMFYYICKKFPFIANKIIDIDSWNRGVYNSQFVIEDNNNTIIKTRPKNYTPKTNENWIHFKLQRDYYLETLVRLSNIVHEHSEFDLDLVLTLINACLKYETFSTKHEWVDIK